MKKYLLILAFLPCIFALSCHSEETNKNPQEENGDKPTDKKEEPQQQTGEVFPAWSEGYLDIHFINAGRGECTFYILPDGTTMVVDAGEVFTSDPTAQPRLPESSKFSYKTFGTYIKHFLPASSGGKLDYALMTHFHIDHIGELDSTNAVHPEGGYQLTGASGLFEEVPFRKLVDRGYPSYYEDSSNYPPESTSTTNYVQFVQYAVAKKVMTAERFVVGSDSQFQLLGATKESYKNNFRIFNHVGNGAGYYKDASGQGRVVAKTPSTENAASCGFHLKYGKFDFIAAGDLVSSAQNYQAYYYRDYVDHLEAFKANHHMAGNSWGGQMQKLAFCPRVIVVQSFDIKKPDPTVLASVFSGVFENATNNWEKDVYLTKHWDDAMEANKDTFSQCKGYGGHVVIRVAPGGESFKVYMLKDTDFSFEIKSESETYTCQ